MSLFVCEYRDDNFIIFSEIKLNKYSPSNQVVKLVNNIVSDIIIRVCRKLSRLFV